MHTVESNSEKTDSFMNKIRSWYISLRVWLTDLRIRLAMGDEKLAFTLSIFIVAMIHMPFLIAFVLFALEVSVPIWLKWAFAIYVLLYLMLIFFAVFLEADT